MGEATQSWKAVVVICLLFFGAVAAVFWPVGHFQFIHCDDPEYVARNSHVQAGLSWAGVNWAFTTTHAGNWHPVTWLSHMLDCQLFGVNPGAHHLVNALLHAINSVLLFLLLQRLTKATWRDAVVAALFALHPLHVESVAWISERKDVLSGMFFMLTLWLYAQYIMAKNLENGTPGTASLPTRKRSHLLYLLSLTMFALGLMSKPMLVTLPFVLLLLDFWPLNRLRFPDHSSHQPESADSTVRTPRSALMEKIPFFALAVLSCIVTVIAQRQANALTSINAAPIELRIENAIVSYAVYLWKTVWPAPLAFSYPFPQTIPLELSIGAVLLLVGISAAAWIWRAKRPWLLMGWLWFLGSLIPVIGLVKVGSQSMADRYTYLPLIGVFIAITWAIAELATSAQRRRRTTYVFAALLAGVCLLLCGFISRHQLNYWRDSETLFGHSLAVTKGNAIVHMNLGAALAERGEYPAAADQFTAALRELPNYAEALSNLGFALAAQDKWTEAVEAYRAAVALKPNISQIHYLLGSALLAQRKIDDAIAEYRTALQLDAGHELALNDLSWVLATASESRLRDGREAVSLAERLCQLSNYQVPQYIGTLAAAYAEAGRFEDASSSAERAEKLAAAAGNRELEARNHKLLQVYREGKAYHEQ